MDPIIEFKENHAAFGTLFGRTDLPHDVTEPVRSVEDSFEDAVAAILTGRDRRRDPSAAADVTATIFAIVRGLIVQLDRSSPLTREVKIAIVGYLRERGFD